MPNEKVMIIYLIVGLLTMVLLYQNELFPTDGHNKNEALKKTEYNELVKNINSIQTAHTSHLGFKNCHKNKQLINLKKKKKKAKEKCLTILKSVCLTEYITTPEFNNLKKQY